MNRLLESIESSIRKASHKLEDTSLTRLSLAAATIAAAIPIAVIIAALIAMSWLNGDAEAGSVQRPFEYPSLHATVSMIGFSVIWAPVLETFLCQFLIIEVIRRITKSWFAQILLSAVVFGAGHLGRSIQSSLIATFVGLFLAFIYVHWLHQSGSRLRAFSAVALAHGAHNFYYVILSFIPASLIL